MDLLERDAARDLITSTLVRAGGGTGATLFVRGDPGIGKTRLLGWAAREAGKRFMVVRAVGHEMETAAPYAMVHQIAAAMHGASSSPAKDLLNASATLRALLTGPKVGETRGAAAPPPVREEIAYAFHWFLASVAEQVPVLLLLDDLHWSDPDSLEVLRFCAWRAHTGALASICGIRSWPPAATRLADRLHGADRAAVLDLMPLTMQATGTLLTRIVDQELPSEQMRAAHVATGGNPLLVEELGRFWSLRDGTAALSPITDASHRTLVVSHLEGLPAESMRLLEAAAVLGDPCTLSEALAVAEVDADAFDRAIAPIALLRLFTVQTLEGEFRHPLLRQIVYDNIAPVRRRHLHRRAAELFRGMTAPATRIAWHVALAAESGNARDVADLRRAARESSSVSAHDSAAFYLRHAADISPPGEQRAEILHELGCEQQLSDAHREASDTFARAAGEASDPRTISQINQSLAFSLTILGESDIARQRLLESITQLAPLDPRAAVEPAIALVVLEITSSRGVMEPIHAGESAVRLAEASGDPVWQGKAKSVWGYAAGFAAVPGTFPMVLKIGQEIPDAPDRVETLWGWSPRFTAGIVAMLTGQYAQAVPLLEQGVAAVHTGSAQHPKILRCAFLAGCYWQMGRLRDAYRLSSEWAMLLEAQPWATSLAKIFETFTLMDIGELDAAVESLQGAQETAARIGFQQAVAFCHVANAVLTARRGRIPEAARLFLQIVPMLDQAELGEIDVFHWMREATDVLVQADELVAAQDLVERMMRFVASSDPERRGLHGVALRCSALLAAKQGDVERAEGAFRQALALHETSHEALEYGRTLLAYGSWMRRAGRPKKSREILRRAVAIFEQCGSTYWRRMGEFEYAAANGRLRTGDAGNLSRLTPQEHRVAELVAQDLTNRQIAASLLISPKTLETHLRHIYEKLQADSREQLKAAFTAWSQGAQAAVGYPAV